MPEVVAEQVAPEARAPYPMETIVRQYGKYRLTAIQPATREGKNALVKQVIPQIAEILRRYDRRMAEQAERETEKESVA